MNEQNENKIMGMIRNVRPVSPPDDFTDRVMDRIESYSLQYSAAERIRAFFTQPRTLKGFGPLTDSITKCQCGFYFILVSLFYFAVGVIFYRSLEIISSTGYQVMWLLYQPEFSFAIAAGFAVFGISFISSRPLSIGLYKFGIVIYVGLVIINSVILQMDMRVPVVAFALLPITIGSIIAGCFLFYAMDRYSRNVRVRER